MLLRNTLTLLGGNGISAGLSFVLSVLIGRALGQAGLGVYASALAWVFPLALLAEFGIGTWITRHIAADLTAPHGALIRSALFARLALGGSITLALIALAPVLTDNPTLQHGLRISAPLILINPVTSTLTAVFRAHRLMLPVALLNVGMLLAQVTLTSAVFLTGGGVISALWVNTLTSAGQMLAVGVWWRVRFPREIRHAPPDSPRVRALLADAFPLAIAALLAAVQLRMGVILLERGASAEQTGYFVAALRFMEGGRLLPFALYDALFPALSSLVAQPRALRRTFTRAAGTLTVYGVIFGAGVTLTAPHLLGLTYGADFLPAQGALVVLAWALLPMSLKYARGLYWYAHRREGLVNGVTLAAVGVQLALSAALIPPYGALGAAWAVLVAEVCALAALWFYPARLA